MRARRPALPASSISKANSRGLQPHVGSVDPRLPRPGVDLEAPEAQHRTRRRRRPAAAAQDRLDAHHGLARRERFADVVVGAEFEAEHPIDLVGTRGNHDDRHAALFAPQRSNDVVAVDARECHVKHEHIRGAASAPQCSVPVGYADYREALSFQMVCEQLANRAIVFSNDDGLRRHAGGSARARRRVGRTQGAFRSADSTQLDGRPLVTKGARSRTPGGGMTSLRRRSLRLGRRAHQRGARLCSAPKNHPCLVYHGGLGCSIC